MNFESIKNNRFVRYSYYFLKGIVSQKDYKMKAKKALDTFEVSFADEKREKSVIRDMFWKKPFLDLSLMNICSTGFTKKVRVNV